MFPNRLLVLFPPRRTFKFTVIRTLCGQSQDEIPSLSFAKAFEKFEKLKEPVSEQKPAHEEKGCDEKDIHFLTLLRNSALMQLGDPNGRIVTGKIFHVVGDDLYIDFGGKLHCVCRRPERDSQSVSVTDQKA